MSTKLRFVLIVEDDRDTRESLIELLDDEGYRTVAVANGQQALQHLVHMRPCLIVADYVMPDMTGGDLVTAVQNQQALRDIPMVLLTAADPTVLRNVRVPVLRKPLDVDALLDVLRQHCGTRAAAA